MSIFTMRMGKTSVFLISNHYEAADTARDFEALSRLNQVLGIMALKIALKASTILIRTIFSLNE